MTISLQDDGGTANGGVDAATAPPFTITVRAVNDPPLFTKGADQTIDEDSGFHSVPAWATSIAPGPDDESGQTVTFTVTSDNAGLFSSLPAVSPDGMLTYASKPDANGVAHVFISAFDNGGSADGGVNTSAPQTFAITVTPVYDAPAGTRGQATTKEDTSVTVQLKGSDVDGNPLTFSIPSRE